MSRCCTRTPGWPWRRPPRPASPGRFGQAARDVFARAAGAGLGDLDDAGLFRLLRRAARLALAAASRRPAPYAPILIVEDNHAIRATSCGCWSSRAATCVGRRRRSAWSARARCAPPWLISDVGVQEMDGSALLEAIRANHDLAATSVMLLTALDNRGASARRDGRRRRYLAKPFTAVELLEALGGLLLAEGPHRGGHRSPGGGARGAPAPSAFTGSLGGTALPDSSRLEAPGGGRSPTRSRGTQCSSPTSATSRRSPRSSVPRGGRTAHRYFERSCGPCWRRAPPEVHRRRPDGVSPTPGGGSPLPASRRAVSAALGMALAAHEFRGWLDQRFGGRGLPPFAIGVGLHAGEVHDLPARRHPQQGTTPIGNTVDVAARLEAASEELGLDGGAGRRACWARPATACRTGGRRRSPCAGTHLRRRRGVTDLLTNIDASDTAWRP